jgi:hypothetical protein
MAEIKTKQHEGDVYSFIEEFVDMDSKKQDSHELKKT